MVPQHPLADEILSPRPGHDGKLTNRACLQYDGDKCVKDHVTEYDLSDPVFRDTANKLGFVCNISGKRYKICKNLAGFCRFEHEQKCFLWMCHDGDITEQFIPATPYQFVLDSNLKCFNSSVYNFESFTGK